MPTIIINNCTYIAIINQLINRQTLYLTTITTATGTVLPPKQTFAAFRLANKQTIQTVGYTG